MADAILFKPKATATAAANLATFVEFSRQLAAFKAKDQFSQDVWDVSETFGRNKKLFFNTADREPLDEPLCSVVKGMVAYSYSLAPMKSAVTYEELTYAARGLHAACRTAGRPMSFIDLDGFAFNGAVEYFRQEGLHPSTLYRRGSALARIAEFLQEHRLVNGPLQWKNTIPKPENLSRRSGRRGDVERAKKLPSQAAMEAIPQIFHLAHQEGSSDTFSQVVTCYCALLMSNPARANELLTQPTDILVDGFSAENSGLGLRWWPEKGGTPLVKPVLDTFDDIVRRAHASLLRNSSQARKVAAWYEEHPTQMYLPPGTEHLRDKEILTYREVNAIFYGGDFDKNRRSSLNGWMAGNNIPVSTVSLTETERRQHKTSGRKPGERHLVRFADLEASVLKCLPSGFPHRLDGWRYSELLFITEGVGLRGAWSDIRVMFSPISYTSILTALGGGKGSLSIFDLYGFSNPDGSPIRLNTHQFRHWLNTLAQLAGMSQLDIALWSGRKNIAQNEVYNHITPEQRLERMRQQVGDKSLATGQLSSMPKVIPIKRADYLAAKIPTAHVTDFGYCVHDFSVAPCQLHRDCLFCNDHVCVKGDLAAEERLQDKLEETRRLLDAAKDALDEEEHGADRWVQHNTEVLARLSALRDVLQDPAIANGAIIQLANPDAPSRLKDALESRVRLEQPYPNGVPANAKSNAARIEKIQSLSRS